MLIKIKKRYGQHFLRDDFVIEQMLRHVALHETTSIFEIGCGDGFLTRRILQYPCARLWVFEIDPEWAHYVKNEIHDSRLSIFIENFLDIDFNRLDAYKPWTVLANLPYQITFPILYKFHAHRNFIKEGVIMVQEEVAQKIVKTTGRGFGFISLFFQHYFDWQLLDKVPPSAFIPSPKVMSRLLYFRPKAFPKYIPDEKQFWIFLKSCFQQPRRTLQNNIQQTHVNIEKIPPNLLKLRAQQMHMGDFISLWELIRS